MPVHEPACKDEKGHRIGGLFVVLSRCNSNILTQAPQVGFEPTTLCIKRVVKSLQVAVLQQVTRSFRVAQDPKKREITRFNRNATATLFRDFIRAIFANVGSSHEWTPASDRLTVEQRLDAARWAL